MKNTHCKDNKAIKQFARPMVKDAEKCQMTLHSNINNALKNNSKNATTTKVQLEEDRVIRNRVNRADLR